MTSSRHFTAMVKSFLTETYWGVLDYLVVDTPPGTSDEHMSIVESLREYRPDGAVLVTTPQARGTLCDLTHLTRGVQNVSLIDVRKEADFCRKAGLPILGVVENMSGYVCPHCAVCCVVACIFHLHSCMFMCPEFADVPTGVLQHLLQRRRRAACHTAVMPVPR